ncbi:MULTISPECIES: ATP-binding protein [Vibrio]|uniref:ATP-binding protein n=1 Tax=Vibrio TaxID=662 RepID=UPI0005EEBA02|nr:MULTISPECIES: ATP-binding protein [Vibrio]MDK9775958.1 ATP-binding protein [Vibrio sp. D401a]MDK9803035.1 ATP-binding protein [Vibrio sp. D406a]USD52258.1 ATP-binding protein [Vibrio sp. SCSIO 43153]
MMEKLVMKKTYFSSLDAPRQVANDVLHSLHRYELLTEEAMWVELAVFELVTNVYEHAYNRVDGLDFSTSVYTLYGQANLSPKIKILVSDKGIGMEMSVFESHINKRIDNAKILGISSLETSGRGLMLVNHLMDDIHYQSKGGLNTFTIIKQLS